jgi:hypothetical protein
VRVLSRRFRGRFVAGLRTSFRDGHLKLHGRLARYRQPHASEQLLRESCRTEWVVYAKPPFEAPEHVLKYLARYTHRIAISNRRLRHVDNARVTFRFKDYRGRRPRTLTLPLAEFVRRFLLHVLPKGFVRIRYYGFLANGTRARLLSCCREALDQEAATPYLSPEHDDDGEAFLDLLPKGLRLCPYCRQGLLRCIQVLERPPPARRPARRAA